MVVARCPVCGDELIAGASASPHPWRCRNGADRHHVLHRVWGDRGVVDGGDANPLIRFDAQLLWASMVEPLGFDAAARRSLIEELDERLIAAGSVAFRSVAIGRSEPLSNHFGFAADGGVWLANTTGEPGGSQKARHLVGALLWLMAMERLDPSRARLRLAIASCGNAAIAASTLAAAVDWPIDVFVPEWANERVVDELDRLGANVTRCPRLATDPPGDPCVFRFREAVDSGAVPFSVQGPENTFALDAGRTFAWEAAGAVGDSMTEWHAQVGGGAFATSLGFGMADAGITSRLVTVQAAGCAPLAGAWRHTQQVGVRTSVAGWTDAMSPWPDPSSVATGILDDETYDWQGIVTALDRCDGRVVTVSEASLIEAHRLVNTLGGIHADHTATASLAALVESGGPIDPTHRVLVWITGIQR